jgi:small subunit ribosomal protein S1
MEFKEKGRNIVVSRRVLLEEEQQANAAAVREKIVPGAVLAGRVTSIRDFGAFVDLGAGVQGLIHVSEMSWSRVSSPSEIVKPGEEITVKVLGVDEARQKISLGLKQLSADPWSMVGDKYEAGQRRSGRITFAADSVIGIHPQNPRCQSRASRTDSQRPDRCPVVSIPAVSWAVLSGLPEFPGHLVRTRP